MNKPQRKPNRLKNFDYGQCGAYFVTICVQHREPILGKIAVHRETTTSVGEDACILPRTCMLQPPPSVELSSYGVAVEKAIVQMPEVSKYVIMPNHVHFLVENYGVECGTMQASSPTVALPQMIRMFKVRVTRELGFPFFQRSYHDHIIRNEQEYRMIWQYIDENPLRWAQDCFYIDTP